jgi:hypothetical protein
MTAPDYASEAQKPLASPGASTDDPRSAAANSAAETSRKVGAPRRPLRPLTVTVSTGRLFLRARDNFGHPAASPQLMAQRRHQLQLSGLRPCTP